MGSRDRKRVIGELTMLAHKGHQVRETSLYAYFDEAETPEDIKAQTRNIVFQHVPICGDGATAWEIAHLCGLPITSVRPRLTELVKKYRAIKETGKKLCTICDRQCITYAKE